ncbi:hypothetical protein [Mesorhizobium sp. B4-1-1]|uniref:hypothetical protein n=1 Tax=Mesorhizobium sp. B4-1-1 TaxID=2589890 RepID=UPI00112DCEB4|nr:hypothetical protein [Mesorhizobium sp. B4-1-1]TPI18570.1 hypothetical protein FJW10_18120 [Mesorhizobium sp. B4-1-1]
MLSFHREFGQEAGTCVEIAVPAGEAGLTLVSRCFSELEATVMRNAATNVAEVVIPDSGHWLMEEATQPTMGAVQGFSVSIAIRQGRRSA